MQQQLATAVPTVAAAQQFPQPVLMLLLRHAGTVTLQRHCQATASPNGATTTDQRLVPTVGVARHTKITITSSASQAPALLMCSLVCVQS
jgi:hypothetical protein